MAGLISLAQKVLPAVFILSLVYAVYSIFLKQNHFSEQEIFQAPLVSETRKRVFQAKKKDYSAFLQTVRREKIFASVYTEKTKQDTGIDRKKISDTIGNLKLVGIVSKEPPKIVIEDKKTNKSFYLREGESFLGGIQVEKIGKNSVVLDYYEEKFELYF